MAFVYRFPLERRLAAPPVGEAGPRGQVLLLPVIRIERHDLPAPPAIVTDPPHRGGNKPKRGRKSA